MSSKTVENQHGKFTAPYTDDCVPRLEVIQAGHLGLECPESGMPTDEAYLLFNLEPGQTGFTSDEDGSMSVVDGAKPGRIIKPSVNHYAWTLMGK